jgi:hypothetical protein
VAVERIVFLKKKAKEKPDEVIVIAEKVHQDFSETGQTSY